MLRRLIRLDVAGTEYIREGLHYSDLRVLVVTSAWNDHIVVILHVPRTSPFFDILAIVLDAEQLDIEVGVSKLNPL